MAQGKARVLIVDDEQPVRQALAAGLTEGRFVSSGLGETDFECATVANAGEAIEALNRETFDVVLLDINMPGKSGIDLLPEITMHHPDVGVVMLTGVDDVSTAVRAMREGALDYINKPVTVAELVVRVEHALSRRSLALENLGYKKKLAEVTKELQERSG